MDRVVLTRFAATNRPTDYACGTRAGSAGQGGGRRAALQTGCRVARALL
jgi:hypothetical protein